MRQSFIFATLCAVLVLCSCGSERPVPPKPMPIIYVVGDGVEPKEQNAAGRPYPINRAQGTAMWRGVRAAYDGSPRVASVKALVTIRGVDDLGNAEEAAARATDIRNDPATLAVIGHATSATTRAAAHLYASSGIPLLMPIATSPFAAYPPGASADPKNRLANSFRLPPADVPVQATAVAIVATTAATAKKVYLLRDVAPDAGEYSQPLYSELLELLADRIVGQEEVNAQRDDFRALALRIRGQAADAVVFCGYGTNANTLLEGMRFLYLDTPAHARPKVILTDGAKISELNTADFDIYLTFPAPDLHRFNCANPDGIRLRNLQNESATTSYELYGYDAMLLVAHAVEKCRSDLSRECVQKTLAGLSSFVGACLPYSFRNGENILSSYYVYTNLIPLSPSRELVFSREISAEEITRFAALRGGM